MLDVPAALGSQAIEDEAFAGLTDIVAILQWAHPRPSAGVASKTVITFRSDFGGIPFGVKS